MPKKRTAENEIVVPANAAPLRRKSAPRTRTNRSAEPVQTPVTNTIDEVAEVAEIASADTFSAPTYQEIAQLAYSFWEGRGHQGGSAEEDWRRAEAQLRSRAAAVNA